MKPILFNTEMMRSILDGRKTVTRRAVKLPTNRMTGKIPNYNDVTGGQLQEQTFHFYENPFYSFSVKPPYRTDDILYVPEAWKCIGTYGELGYEVEFRDGQRVNFKFEDRDRAKKWAKYLYKPAHQWQSPYFMPREAARLFLRVKDVRVERLQDIDDEGAKAEGANCRNGKNVGVEEKVRRSVIERFAEIWDSTIKKADLTRYGWDANPWVWVYTFERISKVEAQEGGEGNG